LLQETAGQAGVAGESTRIRKMTKYEWPAFAEASAWHANIEPSANRVLGELRRLS
jgi:hypothetical protein